MEAISKFRIIRGAFAFAMLATLLAVATLLLGAGNVAQAQTPVAPDNPTGLSATVVAHNSVTLEWSDPSDSSISGYVILRRDPATQSAGTFSTVASDTGSAQTTYTDNTVSAETRYVYRVKAKNSAGTSGRSNFVNVTTPAAPTVPSRPTGLTTTTVTQGSVTLSWSDPGDSSITGYQVLRRSRDGDVYKDGQGSAQFVAVVSNTGTSATTYEDTSVAPHSRYVYRVKARNAQGLSPRSGYLNVETLDFQTQQQRIPAKPAKPTGLEVSSALDSSVTFGWTDPGDDSITDYKVLRREGSSGQFTTIDDNTGSAGTSYTDSTASSDTAYEYRVIAVNSVGDSAESDSLSAQTLPEATAVVIILPPDEEPEDPPISEPQLAVTIVDKGSIVAGANTPTFGTIASAGDRHQYTVALQANRFYRISICGCYTRVSGFSNQQIRLLHSNGNRVQVDGVNLTSSGHAIWTGITIAFQPTAAGTYKVEVGTRDDQHTGTYALRVLDTTISVSSPDEPNNTRGDFRGANIGKLFPADTIAGRLNTNGQRHGGNYIDRDYFRANLHKGTTYTFRFAATSVSSGSKWLDTQVIGPGFRKTYFGGSFNGGSRTETVTLTPDRTGRYAFIIGINGGTSAFTATGAYTVGITQ